MGMDEKLNEGPFIIYGQGVEDFQGGTFWQIADGGAHIFGKLLMGNIFLTRENSLFAHFRGRLKIFLT